MKNYRLHPTKAMDKWYFWELLGDAWTDIHPLDVTFVYDQEITGYSSVFLANMDWYNSNDGKCIEVSNWIISEHGVSKEWEEVIECMKQ